MRILILLFFLLSACAQNKLDALFEVEPSNVESLEERTLKAFRNYVRSNPHSWNLTGDSETVLQQLKIESQSYHNAKISIVRLVQNYRGLPIHKDEAKISLVIRDRKKVVHIKGSLVDPSIDYLGFDKRLSIVHARKAILKHWKREVGGNNFDLESVRLVALPSLKQIAYVGEITIPFLTSSKLIKGSVLVNATTGDLIAIEDRPPEARALVTEIDDNPRNMNLVFRDNLPTTIQSNTINLLAHPDIDCNPVGWRPTRLGDKARHVVVDFEETLGTSIEEISFLEGAQCLSGEPETDFRGGNPGPATNLNNQLLAQDTFFKTQLALAIIDPLMGELVTHGSQHPYTWDHHPSTPVISHRSPLINIVNPALDFLDGVSANYNFIWLSETDTKDFGFPVPHPLVIHCRDNQSNHVNCNDPQASDPFQYSSAISVGVLPPLHTRSLFHEIGHYYDNFNGHGISGENREIIAQLFALYLYQRIYDLDYRLTGNSDVECSLNLLISRGAGRVVHPECISDLDDISTQIEFKTPYTVVSFTQAFWSLLYGVSCTVSDGLSCNEPAVLPTNYSDRWMEALLFALQLSNNLEPIEIWDAMAIFIDANYPEDRELLQTVRTLHGLI